MRSLVRSALLLLLLIATAAPAFAVVRYVRSTDGVDLGSCDAEPTPCATLGYAVSQAAGGDTVWLAGDFAESVTLDEPITIEGKSAPTVPSPWGVCVGTSGPTRCPTIRPPAGSHALTVDVLVGEAVSIHDFNAADADGAAAIRVIGGTLLLERCNISDNENLNDPGGGLDARGVVGVRDCVFDRNQARNGGAIYSTGSLAVFDSSFTLNTAGQEGGAISSSSGNGELYVDGATFQQNFAALSGGAISSSIAFSAHVVDTLFVANATESEGGALYAANVLSAVTIEGSEFSQNRADGPGASGGAIYLSRSDGSIDGVEVTSNTVATPTGLALEGGGITLFESDVSIHRTSVVGNEIDSSSTANNGDGIHVTAGDVTITESLLRDNGEVGIGTSQTTLTVSDSTLDGHSIGILSETGGGSDIDVFRSTISGSTIRSIALESGSDVVDVFNSTLSGGTVTLLASARLNLQYSTVVSSGAALQATTGGRIDVSDSIISGTCASPGSTINFIDANVWDDPSCGAGSVADVGLMPLGDYGGPTETHALRATSPAIDAGILRCLPVPIDGEDQRGALRPVGIFCDLGAVELPEPGALPGLLAGIALLSRLPRSPGQSSRKGRSDRASE